MGRNRTCSNPPHKNGGRDCEGMSRQTHACNTQTCGPNTDTQSGERCYASTLLILTFRERLQTVMCSLLRLFAAGCTGGMILVEEEDCLAGELDPCPVTCSDLHSERNCTLNCTTGTTSPPFPFHLLIEYN